MRLEGQCACRLPRYDTMLSVELQQHLASALMLQCSRSGQVGLLHPFVPLRYIAVLGKD